MFVEGQADQPAIADDSFAVFHGSCLDVLKSLPDCSVDSVVTDPPYELGFMGKRWDSSGIAFNVEVWEQALRVLKPGGHLLAFGGSRTWHRLAVAIEDAGFEVRDSIAWLYGSGFPKSLDISKAIDKAAGAEREVVGSYTVGGTAAKGKHKGRAAADSDEGSAAGFTKELSITAPATPEAEQWQGWGTALKPAFEPVVVARKPLAGTVAANVLQFGAGGLNIDGSRIGTSGGTKGTGIDLSHRVGDPKMGFRKNNEITQLDAGRWPANVILDETTAELLDDQADASRFFYVAKASKRDRNEGLQDLEAQQIGGKGNDLARSCAVCGSSVLDGCECPDRTFVNPARQNFHPTVKPTTLMRYLIKLVTPTGGVVLDPFTGSGSTGKAAILEGFQFVGIELNAEYLPIIEGRLRWAVEQVEEQLPL